MSDTQKLPEAIEALCLAFGIEPELCEYKSGAPSDWKFWVSAEPGPRDYDTFADALRAAVSLNVYGAIQAVGDRVTALDERVPTETPIERWDRMAERGEFATLRRQELDPPPTPESRSS